MFSVHIIEKLRYGKQSITQVNEGKIEKGMQRSKRKKMEKESKKKKKNEELGLSRGRKMNKRE